MIHAVAPEAPECKSLDWAHPLVREWFVAKFGTPTEPQELGWPHILARKNTLICAPTGSGKTLAAFLACIDALVRKALAGDLLDQTEVLYVSPLKALGNDIQRNLDVPLGEILQLARERGYLMPEIRTAVRTGDTLIRDRLAMQKRPPHILVTTPESLYILLTAGKSRELLRTVRTVIVDEIHAVADDKRGIASRPVPGTPRSAHRAAAHQDRTFGHAEADRAGRPVSHRQRPARARDRGDRAAPAVSTSPSKFRPANSAPSLPTKCGMRSTNASPSLVQQHRSTLIFVNTRRLAERLAHHLAALLGEDAVASHHGSLSRLRRLAVESKLKAGEIRALVATASLELGIDIGTVDLVCQIGSPRSISVALQRAGRAGSLARRDPQKPLFRHHAR